MSIDFRPADVKHNVSAKFVPAWLPASKKKYNARVVYQPELDIHGIASKASLYNISTPPTTIEEGLRVGLQLIAMMIADNYCFKCDLFTIGVRIPGEYDGTETQMPEGVYPEIRLTVSPALRKYIRENVHVVFSGIEEANGLIGQIIDDFTGSTDSIITPGNIVTVNGDGLKVTSDAQHADQVGVFLLDSEGIETPVKALPVNTPRQLKLLTPNVLPSGKEYTLLVRTQSSAKGGGSMLKGVREVLSTVRIHAQ